MRTCTACSRQYEEPEGMICTHFDVIETKDGLWLSCETCSEEQLQASVDALKEALKERSSEVSKEA